MDIEARRGLWFQVRNLAATGKTMLLTTHYIEEADALSDRVAVLNHGHVIAQGTPSRSRKSSPAAKSAALPSSLPTSPPRSPDPLPPSSPTAMPSSSLPPTPSPSARELLRADPTPRNLEISSAALEDAFLALTKN